METSEELAQGTSSDEISSTDVLQYQDEAASTGSQQTTDIDPEDVHVMENLRIKIGDAKNLSTGNRDYRNCYCSVHLDQEEVFRTRTVEKTLSPFFQEEWDFDIPHNFRNLCFYLHDIHDEVLSKRDVAFAKVIIRKSDLNKYNGKEEWFPLLPVRSATEVQGQVYVELVFQQIQTLGIDNESKKLQIKVSECSGLALSSGGCDPYAVVSLIGTHRNDSKKTRVRKSTVNPHFEEEFTFYLTKNNNVRRSWFDLSPLGNNNDIKLEPDRWEYLTVKISLYSSGTLGDEFLGEIRIPLNTISKKEKHVGWYLLQSRQQTTNSSLSNLSQDLGALRLNISYSVDHVFPTFCYEELLNNLLKSPAIEPISASPAFILGEVCKVTDRTHVAGCLVRIFLQQGTLASFIAAIANKEITNSADGSTLFRNSTMVTHCIEASMRIVGFQYLQLVLSSFIEKIRIEKKICEIDWSRIGQMTKLSSIDITSNVDGTSDQTSPINNTLRLNKQNLSEYVIELVSIISKSAAQCPSVLCDIFSSLRNSAALHYPDNICARYIVVINFIFLRFFSAALLCPQKNKLIKENLDKDTLRTLTLVSKTLQYMCTLAIPRPPEAGNTAKALSNNTMHAFVRECITTDHIDLLKNYLDVISSKMDVVHRKGRSCSILDKVVLKEGPMVKRAQGRTWLLSRKNFKTRYFFLTNYELFYCRKKNSKPLCVIPVHEICGVETLQEDSFRMAYMFQVIQPTRVLYCKAMNSVEQKEWIDILTKVCTCNKNRVQNYHPGAYVQGKYICCGATATRATGCSRVTGIPSTIHLDTGLDRDLERVFVVLSQSHEYLLKLQEECGERAVYMGPKPTPPSSFDITDPQIKFLNVKNLLDVIGQLDTIHKRYLTITNKLKAKVGTQERPYGDT